MQSVQRQFGKLRRKASVDDAQVTALVRDYNEVEKAITKITDDARVLQNSWHDMAIYQLGIASAYQTLYEPIASTAEDQGRPQPAALPRRLAARTASLEQAYSGLKDELVGEIAAIETQLLQPATDVRNMLQPMKKTIKKRDHKRVDLANAEDKASRMQSKQTRSAKEESQLVKTQGEVAHLTEEFDIADSHLRSTLPPLIQATYKIMPHLLANHIAIQNRLWGLCYTILHEYCQANGFPSPPPHLDEVVAAWDQAFQPIVQKVDSFSSVRKFSALNPKTGLDRPTLTSRLSSSKQAASPETRIPSDSPGMRPETQEYPSTSPGQRTEAATPSGLAVPTDFTTATVLRGQRSPESTSSQRNDYLGQAVVQAKRKPPPPPPPGPKPIVKKAEYVVALYDFQGQGAGDLSFNEGDIIQIITKTETDQDWWEGELNGVRGSFPANYCQLAT